MKNIRVIETSLLQEGLESRILESVSPNSEPLLVYNDDDTGQRIIECHADAEGNVRPGVIYYVDNYCDNVNYCIVCCYPKQVAARYGYRVFDNSINTPVGVKVELGNTVYSDGSVTARITVSA